jgi:hypothetical protein
MFKGVVRKSVVSLLDTGSRLQAPIAANYVEFLRRRHPAHSPDQIAGRLEQQYLITVLGSGVAVGLSAAVPGVGTLIGLAATAAESAFFLEVSTVYTLATTTAHGIDPAQTPRRRDLVLEVVLGEDGMQIIEKNAAHPAKNWETVLADKIPGLRNMKDSPPKRFLVHFVAKRGVLTFGRVLPAGIGAVIGGAGNPRARQGRDQQCPARARSRATDLADLGIPCRRECLDRSQSVPALTMSGESGSEGVTVELSAWCERQALDRQELDRHARARQGRTQVPPDLVGARGVAVHHDRRRGRLAHAGVGHRDAGGLRDAW